MLNYQRVILLVSYYLMVMEDLEAYFLQAVCRLPPAFSGVLQSDASLG